MTPRADVKTNLYYELHGQMSPWLTFVHGGLVDSRTWQQGLPSLAFCRTLTYDLRGYGRSGKPEMDWDISDHARDLLGLWDELGIAQSILLGFSLGGFVSQETAVTAPERVSGLILVSTAARLDQAARAVFLARAAELAHGPIDVELAHHVRRAFSLKFRESQAEAVSDYANDIARNERHVIAHTFDSIASFDQLDQLSLITCPTLILVGEYDEGMHVGYARELAQRISGAKLVTVSGVGHTIHVEAPNVFYELVGEFVKSVNVLAG